MENVIDTESTYITDLVSFLTDMVLETSEYKAIADDYKEVDHSPISLSSIQYQQILFEQYKRNCFYKSVLDSGFVCQIGIEKLNIPQCLKNTKGFPKKDWLYNGIAFKTLYNKPIYNVDVEGNTFILAKDTWSMSSSNWQFGLDLNGNLTYHYWNFLLINGLKSGARLETAHNIEDMFTKSELIALDELEEALLSYTEEEYLKEIQNIGFPVEKPFFIYTYEDFNEYRKIWLYEIHILKKEIVNTSEFIQALWDLNIFTGNFHDNITY